MSTEGRADEVCDCGCGRSTAVGGLRCRIAWIGMESVTVNPKVSGIGCVRDLGDASWGYLCESKADVPSRLV